LHRRAGREGLLKQAAIQAESWTSPPVSSKSAQVLTYVTRKPRKKKGERFKKGKDNTQKPALNKASLKLFTIKIQKQITKRCWPQRHHAVLRIPGERKSAKNRKQESDNPKRQKSRDRRGGGIVGTRNEDQVFFQAINWTFPSSDKKKEGLGGWCGKNLVPLAKHPCLKKGQEVSITKSQRISEVRRAKRTMSGESGIARRKWNVLGGGRGSPGSLQQGAKEGGK